MDFLYKLTRILQLYLSMANHSLCIVTKKPRTKESAWSGFELSGSRMLTIASAWYSWKI